MEKRWIERTPMIHTFISHGYHIVVDTYSGGVHLVDPPSFQAIEWINREFPDNPTQGLTDDHWASLVRDLAQEFPNLAAGDLEGIREEIRSLVDEGSLFSRDTYADLSLDLTQRKTQVKALCLNVAHTCNLDCDYCFASQGKYHGERAIMSLEVAKQAIDFLIENSGSHRNLDIDFFGGEPMLNWDVVKETVAYADSQAEKQDKNFRYTFTTNGLLLDKEVSDFLNKHMHNVVLSLDGRKEVHDRLRHRIDGRGSYDTIVPKFQDFVRSRGEKEYYIRGTYTGKNPDFYQDILHMANLGFHRLSMEPVIGDPEEDYMLSEKDLPILEAQYDLLTEEMLRRDRLADEVIRKGGSVEDMDDRDRPFVFYHFMMNLDGGPCIYKRISGCGSGTEYMAVTPWGDLYPCHQFVGDENFTVGNVFEGIQKDAIIKDFKTCNTYSRPECQDCWARLYCSGGCAANSYHASGTIQGTVPFSCQLFRKRMECALTLKVDQMVRQNQ